MLTPFCPQTIECICTYYISVCIRSGLILLLRSLHCIYWDHRAVGTEARGSGRISIQSPPPKILVYIEEKHFPSKRLWITFYPFRFLDFPSPQDRVVVGKNSSKQMCMTKTGWCCCVTRPHFSPHASSNRALCSVPHAIRHMLPCAAPPPAPWHLICHAFSYFCRSLSKGCSSSLS